MVKKLLKSLIMGYSDNDILICAAYNFLPVSFNMFFWSKSLISVKEIEESREINAWILDRKSVMEPEIKDLF